jgi:hypothetical protein
LYGLSNSKDLSTVDANIHLYTDYAKLKIIDNKNPEITIKSIED